MTGDQELVLSALADRRWRTVVFLARETGLETDFVRGAMWNFSQVGWITRGGVVGGHGARLWQVTKKGLTQLEGLAHSRATGRPLRRKTGPRALTLDEYRAREARKAI